VTDRESDLRVQLEADYEAIDVHYLEGRLTEYLEASMALRDRALAIEDKARAAEIMSWATAAAVMSGDPRAEEVAAEAEQLARVADLPIVAARVSRYRAWLARFRGDPRPLESATRNWLASARAASDRQGIVNARRALGEGLMEEGRFVEAEDEFRGALELSRELGEAFSRTEILCGTARLALERDNIEAADRDATEAVEGVRPGDLVAVSAARQALASVRAAQHDDAAAESGFRDALGTIAGTEYRERWVEASIAYARFLAEHGRGDEAEAILRPVEEWLEAHGYVFRRLQILAIREQLIH
jgi:hypothetical protein